MLEEQLAGLRLGMFVYYQKRLLDFYFSGCFRWLSSPSVCVTGCTAVTAARGGQGWRDGT